MGDFWQDLGQAVGGSVVGSTAGGLVLGAPGAVLGGAVGGGMGLDDLMDQAGWLWGDQPKSKTSHTGGDSGMSDTEEAYAAGAGTLDGGGKEEQYAAFFRGMRDEAFKYAQSVISELQKLAPEGIDMGTLGREATGVAGQLGDQATAAMRQLSAENLANLPGLSNTVLGQAMVAANSMDAETAKSFYASLDNLMPDWRDRLIKDVAQAQQQASAQATDYLTRYYPGQQAQLAELGSIMAARSKTMMTEGMPKDLADKIARRFAEGALSKGLYGQGAISAGAMTHAAGEIDFLQKGATLAGQAAGLFGQSSTLAQGAVGLAGANIQSATLLQQQIKSLMPATVDRGALYSGMLGQMIPTTMAPAATALQTQAQLGQASLQIGSDVSQFNRELEWAPVISGLNYGADASAQGLAYTLARYGLHMQRGSEIGAGVAAVIGASMGMIGGAISSRSDGRLKTDVKDVESGLEVVRNLKPKTYVLHEPGNPAKSEAGLVAQDVQKVVPTAVGPLFQGDPYLGVDYKQMIPFLIRAVQELEAKVNALEQERRK